MGGEERELTTKGPKRPSCSDGNTVWESIKIDRTVYPKRVNFILCKVYLNKNDFKRLERLQILLKVIYIVIQ